MSTQSSGRILFSSRKSAVRALILVLEDARKTTRIYTFTGLNHHRLIENGMVLSGEIDEVKNKILALTGTEWSDY